ncbi:MAG TPA: diguanylate cyclase [Solirubrobacterales bacterium]|nr:diguanylate cyclase [Solirubrobacterales bacterium]
MRRRFWLGIAAVALVAIGSVLVAFLVYADDRDDFDLRQRDEAARAAHQMEALAGLSVNQLNSAAAFIKAEDDLSRHEFQVYGNSLIRQGALAGAVYIPRVTQTQRERFERAQGIEILERDGLTGFRRARSQPAYFPITYVAAAEEEQGRALGYDLGRDPARRPYLDRARDSGSAVSSLVIPLLIGGRGINVFRAVYRDGAPVKTVAQRRRALVGYAAGSFRIETLASSAGETVSPGVRLQLRAGGEAVFGAQGDLDGASAPLAIADRTWVLAVEDPDGPGLSLPIALAVLGIAIAALLGSLIVTWSRRERMEQLEREASQDALTGLDNRRRFERDLARAMARSRRDHTTGALLILDIDDFKRVNDSQGHQAGDRLIQGVASVLRRRTRQSDTLARLGGDEFAVILPRSTRTEAQLAAEAIAREVREHRSDEESESVTVSVGVAMFGNDPRTSAATVFSEADTAMYTAKDEGRDGVRIFDPEAVREDASER